MVLIVAIGIVTVRLVGFASGLAVGLVGGVVIGIAVSLGVVIGLSLVNQALHARLVYIGVVLREAITRKGKLIILRIVETVVVSYPKACEGFW